MPKRGPAQFIRQIRVDPLAKTGGYPFTLPAVAHLIRSGSLKFNRGVTFIVGENGSGKSTLIEAIAVAAGFNPEGGSQNFRFATRATESVLGDYLILTWNTTKPRTGFFLRAESYYNVASEIERLDRADPAHPLLPAYGGVAPHERSHGESFLDLITHRFGPRGLYLLDEPEAALSVRGCVAALSRLAEIVEQGSQIIVATHSPIMLALPGATILAITDDGALVETSYDDAPPVRLTRDFLGVSRDPLRPARECDR
ncbi:MAG TPA: AAA family ATPase [Pseudonocardiaceae bacterium]|nr:AAA family ATPase [Pseudonocardiaceae bacterium]